MLSVSPISLATFQATFASRTCCFPVLFSLVLSYLESFCLACSCLALSRWAACCFLLSCTAAWSPLTRPLAFAVSICFFSVFPVAMSDFSVSKGL